MDDPVIAFVLGKEAVARGEQRVRMAAMPGALVFAFVAVKAAPVFVRLLSMWVHETGHAITAWLCGYQAFPGPWFTPVTTERSPLFTCVLAALVVAGGYRAWQRQRWFWVSVAVVALLLIFEGTFVLGPASAQQLIVFFGDGGALVLGTLLMFTIYARESNPVRTNQLRWGFLIIGALAFMDVFDVWTRPIDQLPFGENENGLSDPTVLVEQYGWTVRMLVGRYHQLSYVCFGALAAVYLWGLRPARRTP